MQARPTRPRPRRLLLSALLLPALLALAAAGAPALAAQESEEDDSGPPWRTSYFPYFSGMANDGPVISARIRYWQPAPYEAQTTYPAALDGAV